jgi:hypothetical protein
MPGIDRVRVELDRLTATREWASRNRPAVWAAILCAVALAVYGVWFVYVMIRGLPEAEELRALTDDSAQTTTIYDAHERAAFTIPTAPVNHAG